MPEETTEMNTVSLPPDDSGTSGTMILYRKTSFLVGMYLMLIMILRYIAVLIIGIISSDLTEPLGNELCYVIELAVSGTFLQILPSVLGALMFGYIGRNSKKLRSLYTIPKSNTRAISNFSAVYGLAQIVNIITLIVTFFLTRNASIDKALNTVADSASYGPLAVWTMFVLLVFIAPIFEEFIFRGIIQNALKPYGNGLAIFVSGIAFGLYHGNFQQCFYTAAAGIALGYIANVTGSIFPTTVIHMIMNSLSGIMILLLNTDSVQKYIIKGSEENIPESQMILVAAYGIYMVCLLIFIIIGFISAVMKIVKIKKYKTKKVWEEVGNPEKVFVILTTVPMIITLIMFIDTYSGFGTSLINKLVTGEM